MRSSTVPVWRQSSGGQRRGWVAERTEGHLGEGERNSSGRGHAGKARRALKRERGRPGQQRSRRRRGEQAFDPGAALEDGVAVGGPAKLQ